MTTPTQDALDDIHATMGIMRDQITSIRAAQEADVRVVALLHDRLMRLENMMIRYLDKEVRA